MTFPLGLILLFYVDMKSLPFHFVNVYHQQTSFHFRPPDENNAQHQNNMWGYFKSLPTHNNFRGVSFLEAL